MQAQESTPLDIAPGLYTERTPKSAGNRWVEAQNVRWRDRGVETRGGAVKAANTQFLGKCRGMADWVTLELKRYIAMGTHLKLYLFDLSAFSDITPYRDSGTIANPFTTTNGSPLVKVTDSGHGNEVGDYVHFSGASAVGGITVSGEYTVTSVQDANNFFITHSSNATSGAGPGGGGSVAYAYEMHIGQADTISLYGWGAGTWGSSTWGTPRSSTTLSARARTWSLDPWGEDLIINPRDEAIYRWDASAGTNTRAAIISQAPSKAKCILVDESRHLIAFGAHDGSAQDPLLVRWCDQEDYTVWTPAGDNTAGDYRLSSGNEIMAAIRTKGQNLVLTDVSAHTMYYTADEFVFGFKPLGEQCGLIGPKAVAEINGVVIWAGRENFFIFDGAVRILSCDVWSKIYKNLNRDQKEKIYADLNPEHNEIVFFYPSEGSTECDKYVAVNYIDYTWSYGTRAKTAWIGSRTVGQKPYAAGANGYLYIEETGTSDDGAAIECYAKTSLLSLSDGNDATHLSRVVPDPKEITGSVALSLIGRKFPNSQAPDVKTKGPYTMTSTTAKLSVRARNNYHQLYLYSNATDASWAFDQFSLKGGKHGQR